jgi:elongation factor G
MHANNREEVTQAKAGEIVAIVGLKNTKTADTLCDKDAPLILESITFPEPVISLAIEPKTKHDQEKLSLALNKLAEEDPTFQIKSNPETNQTIISGMGELHLEILVDRLKREFKVDANTGQPQVAYKETITASAEAEGKYIRQSGGRGQYGHCQLVVKPLPRGQGISFNNKITGGAIPREFIPGVEKGVREALNNGVVAGYPATDIAIDLVDGSYHDVDSSELAFKIAGSIALQAAFKKASPIILEPVMKVEVTTPEVYLGDVIGDLSSRRAQISATLERNKARIVTANIPLSEMGSYATAVRSLTAGRASYYMEPSHYQPLPANLTEKLLKKNSTS